MVAMEITLSYLCARYQLAAFKVMSVFVAGLHVLCEVRALNQEADSISEQI
jgi:hypothetical protein